MALRCVQVLVVVTEEWGVLGFDSALNLLWETKVSHLDERYTDGSVRLVHR